MNPAIKALVDAINIHAFMDGTGATPIKVQPPDGFILQLADGTTWAVTTYQQGNQ